MDQYPQTFNRENLLPQYRRQPEPQEPRTSILTLAFLVSFFAVLGIVLILFPEDLLAGIKYAKAKYIDKKEFVYKEPEPTPKPVPQETLTPRDFEIDQKAERDKRMVLIEKDEATRRTHMNKKELLEIMKTKGCVADGLLSGHGGAHKKDLEMISRSNCRYLHRGIETWREAPDFEDIEENIAMIDKKGMVYGMFIAEALDTKEDVKFFAKDRDFKFSSMCRPRSKNVWGEHTCKPYFKKEEYRAYLNYITERAMDLGVQSFMFGQIFYQENEDLSDPIIDDIIFDMREYASYRNIEIVVGAQTNDILNPEYLQLFDYIEGGVGVSPSGRIEDGPCFSRWWKKPGDWCWALLWHEKYASRANNVLLHLDWSGRLGDDMSTYARMSPALRAKTVQRLHTFFTQQGHGFLVPFLAPLPKNNGSCTGAREDFYSANREFSCDDEDALNAILE